MKFEKTFKEQYSTFPTQGLNPGLLSLWEDSLPAEPQGKPMSTTVGSLSLPQQIFATQDLNRGLLHCRQILYQIIRALFFLTHISLSNLEEINHKKRGQRGLGFGTEHTATQTCRSLIYIVPPFNQL